MRVVVLSVIFGIVFILRSDLIGQSGVIISPQIIPNEPGVILNVQSPHQGVLLPKTQTSSILSPVDGLMIFDTIENSIMLYDSIAWVPLVKGPFMLFYADHDGDAWGDPLSAIYAPFAPPGYVAGLDCDDTNPNIAPGLPDLCDGLDNDCNPETTDGSNDGAVGIACDGLDTDLCPEGVTQCINGLIVCSDLTDDSPEICADEIDNDCDGLIDEDCVTVEWAILQHPPAINIAPGSTPNIYGHVYAGGVTDAVGQGAGISAQVGYGADGSDPSMMGVWIWTNATYNVDVMNNDEYQGVLIVTETGIYDYAYRFTGDGGVTWVYADLDGTTDGYDPADAGSLVVSVPIDWGNLQFPTTIEMEPGSTPAIFGQVYSAGITDVVGQGMGITAQVGYGPDGSDPSLGGWTWVSVTYNTDVMNNDEYQGTFVVSETGTYDYAYRYSGDGGATWVYADLTGTADGYNAADAGSLIVN